MILLDAAQGSSASPDYSRQLDQIIRVLSKQMPWWQHPWVLAGVAAMFGVVGGFLGQIILLAYSSHAKLKTMRRMAYADIGEFAIVVNEVLRFPGFDDTDEGKFKMKEHYRAVAPRMSEDYIKANPEAYARLPERISYEAIHKLHSELLGEPYDFKGYLRSTMRIIALHFRERRLSIQLVKKFSGKEAAALITKVLEQHDSDQSGKSVSR